MAAQQFLCSAAPCSAWLLCGASCVVKGKEVIKASPKKLLPLILSGIAVTSLFSVRPAQAFTITLQQMGSNVVANGSGAINLTGLNFFGTAIRVTNVIIASGGFISLGGVGGNVTNYTGLSGPTNFGSGGQFDTTTGSGNNVAINGLFGGLAVPQGYVSGAALSGSATWNNATFASLGVTPGTYKWTWGTGLPNQNFTLQIGPATVPDSGSTVSLLGCALLGLATLRRKLAR